MFVWTDRHDCTQEEKDDAIRNLEDSKEGVTLSGFSKYMMNVDFNLRSAATGKSMVAVPIDMTAMFTITKEGAKMLSVSTSCIEHGVIKKAIDDGVPFSGLDNPSVQYTSFITHEKGSELVYGKKDWDAHVMTEEELEVRTAEIAEAKAIAEMKKEEEAKAVQESAVAGTGAAIVEETKVVADANTLTESLESEVMESADAYDTSDRGRKRHLMGDDTGMYKNDEDKEHNDNKKQRNERSGNEDDCDRLEMLEDRSETVMKNQNQFDNNCTRNVLDDTDGHTNQAHAISKVVIVKQEPDCY